MGNKVWHPGSIFVVSDIRTSPTPWSTWISWLSKTPNWALTMRFSLFLLGYCWNGVSNCYFMAKSLICIVLLNNKNPYFMGRTRQHSYQSLQEESDAHNCLWAYQLSDSLSFCMWKRRECPCSTQPKIQGSLAIHRILQVAADSATQRRLLVTEPLQPLPIWWMSPWKLL